jgi:hypothetical protein
MTLGIDGHANDFTQINAGWKVAELSERRVQTRNIGSGVDRRGCTQHKRGKRDESFLHEMFLPKIANANVERRVARKSAQTKCISDVPGFAKQMSTPWLARGGDQGLCAVHAVAFTLWCSNSFMRD